MKLGLHDWNYSIARTGEDHPNACRHCPHR